MTKDTTKKPKAKNKPAHKKVFDVVPPGKSIAAPNSRSVIMGHKPQVKDDQFMPGSGASSSGSGAGSASDSGSRPSAGGAGQGSRLAGNPSEKRPLLDSRKKIELKPQNGSAGQVSEQNTAANKTAATVTTAPALPKDASLSLKELALKGSTDVPPAAESAERSPMAAAAAHAAPATAPLVPAPKNSQQTEVQNGAVTSTVTSEHLADLAVEQVVDADDIDTIGVIGAGVSGVSGDGPGSESTIAQGADSPRDIQAQDAQNPIENAVENTRPKTVDDLLAETGAPDLEPQKAIVSTHRHHTSFLHALLILLLVLIVSLIALNFLLDAGIIETGWDVPYTDLIR